MATHTWPATLPQKFVESGFSYGLKPMAVVNQPEVGEARSRRRTTRAIYLIRGSVVTGRTNIQTFLDFFVRDLSGGAVKFNWVDPYDETDVVEMLFVSRDLSRMLSPVGPVSVAISMELEMYK